VAAVWTSHGPDGREQGRPFGGDPGVASQTAFFGLSFLNRRWDLGIFPRTPANSFSPSRSHERFETIEAADYDRDIHGYRRIRG